jgi:hypothetical protein
MSANFELCRDCGQQVSKSAARCPHCGGELMSRQRFAMGVATGFLAVVFIGLVIVLILIGLAFLSH